MRSISGIAAAVLLLGLACSTTSGHADGAGGSLHAGVQKLMEIIPRDLARSGPRGWLPHFRRSPTFYMASDGQLVFPSNTAADSAITLMAASVASMELEWQDLRIDSLAPDLAAIGTPFTERITDLSGGHQDFRGYFTAVAERADSGWQFRSLHWSLIHGAPSH